MWLSSPFYRWENWSITVLLSNGVCVCVCVCARARTRARARTQLCLILCDLIWTVAHQAPVQGLNPCLLCLLPWQADSLQLHHLGSKSGRGNSNLGKLTFQPLVLAGGWSKNWRWPKFDCTPWGWGEDGDRWGWRAEVLPRAPGDSPQGVSSSQIHSMALS